PRRRLARTRDRRLTTSDALRPRGRRAPGLRSLRSRRDDREWPGPRHRHRSASRRARGRRAHERGTRLPAPGRPSARERAALARTIERRGAVVSQFPAGMPALPGHFPARNRTLAGLALGVVVVEAAEKSGALITAGFAGDLGRETYAVPGRITSVSSAGANRLIQDGAKLVTCWQDVVSELPEPWRRAVRGPLTSTDVPSQPEIGSDEGRMFRL